MLHRDLGLAQRVGKGQRNAAEVSDDGCLVGGWVTGTVSTPIGSRNMLEMVTS